MGSKIANDTPKNILNILNKVDVKKIDTTKLSAWLRIAKENIGNYIPKRLKAAINFVELSVNLPKEMVQMFNEYDFNAIGAIKKLVVFPIAEAWIKNNLPMK